MTERSFWNKGYIYLIVGAIVLVAGLNIFKRGVVGIVADLNIANWKQIEAKIESFAVQPYFFNNTPAGHHVVATYSYVFAEKQYNSNKVAFDSTFGDDPSELLRIKKILGDAVEKKEAFPALVDPKMPDNSVLFRATALKAYLSASFGAVLMALSGLLITVFIYCFSVDQKRNDRKHKNPHKPWLWEETWQDFSIVAQPKWSKILPIAGFSFFIWLVSLIIALIVFIQPKSGFEEYCGVAFLVCVDLLLARLCLSRWRGEAWAEKIVLVAASYPIVPGKDWKFRVQVQNSKDLEIVGGLKFYLKSRQNTGMAGIGSGRGSVRSNRAVTEVLFKEDGHTCFALNPSIKVEGRDLTFDLIAKLPETAENTELAVEFETKWQVILYFAGSGKEFIETFEVPVYSEDKFASMDENNGF